LKRFEHELLNGLSAWHSELVLLQIIPGIDIMGAAMLLVEISAQMEGFGSAERLASWVSICPGNNESAGKRKMGKIRNGNAWVRRLLCEFAQAVSRSRCALEDKFAALSIRKGHKKSIVALAHKMLRIIFAVLRNKMPYRDKAVDYEALSVWRNAQRWMEMLIKHGHMPTPA
jgi:transposase